MPVWRDPRARRADRAAVDADPRAPFDARRTGQFIDEGVAGVQQDVEEDLRYVSAVQVERREVGGELGLQHDATIDGLAE